jgi:hypothetical protein
VLAASIIRAIIALQASTSETSINFYQIKRRRIKSLSILRLIYTTRNCVAVTGHTALLWHKGNLSSPVTLKTDLLAEVCKWRGHPLWSPRAACLP